MYLFYFLLGALLFVGARVCGRGEWNEEYTSLRQTRMLLGVAALGVALHHMGQKSCAPWHKQQYIVHGLDFFVPIGFPLVALFLFCSGFGLYRSLKTKPDYLRGFFKRRVAPIVAAYYLSELIYLAVRAAVGQQMETADVLWYLTGLHMANFNAWYAVVIVFFYAAFYLAFRYSRSDGAAILYVTAFTVAYTVFGACLDHQDVWWMQGEWWYNSIIMFPLGLLFGKYEAKLTAFFKRGYPFWLALSLAATVGLFHLSVLVSEVWWGYYGENWDDPLKVLHRLGSCGAQWLVCVAFVAFCFLLLMKLRLGNRVLGLLGGVTLEFYLIHGVFVELFGYNFQEIAPSLTYIRDVPTYIAAVLACSAVATALFRWLWKLSLRALGLQRR
ncbi:MAG: acyltransferase [Clostridia bacterium]|nr:acyltransferase [Clostridia bacterium]